MKQILQTPKIFQHIDLFYMRNISLTLTEIALQMWPLVFLMSEHGHNYKFHRRISVHTLSNIYQNSCCVPSKYSWNNDLSTIFEKLKPQIQESFFIKKISTSFDLCTFFQIIFLINICIFINFELLANMNTYNHHCSYFNNQPNSWLDSWIKMTIHPTSFLVLI